VHWALPIFFSAGVIWQEFMWGNQKYRLIRKNNIATHGDHFSSL
jgi:hypothetical protein